MAQTKTIQLLRSSQVYANLEAAKTGIQGAAGTRHDGELLLGRYWSGTTNPVIKSVIGIYHKSPDLTAGENDPTTISAGWTFIQDITSSDEGLQHLQDEVDQIESTLGINTDGTWTGYASGSDIVGEQSTVTGTLAAVITYLTGLDLAQVGGGNGDIITTVSQANGQVSASKSSLTDVLMTGYAADSTQTGAIAATDTLEQAFNKVENAIAANEVASTDGTITVTHPTTGTNAGKTDLAVTIDGTTIVKSNAGVLKSDLELTQLTSSELTALNNSNVKEAYKLIYHTDSNRTAIGDVVKIYKDSSLLSVELLHADLDAATPLKPTYSDGTWTDIDSASQTEENLALCFAYQLADGTTSVEAVPVGNFLRESEFGDGLQVVSGVVSVKKDTSSGKVRTGDTGLVDVLTVSSNGVKVDNIQAAIDYAVQNSSTSLAISAEGDNYITAAVDANNNKKINVTADVQSLTATAGTVGVYDSTTGAQTTAPVAGILSGVADSLGDAADIATKVKTYVDGAIAIEAARSDAKNLADLKTVVEGLDGTATASSATNLDTTPSADFKVLTKVAEVDGKVVETTVTNGSTAVTLKKLAATGAAADVSIADSNNLITETTVEGALQEIATNVRNNALVSNDVIVVTPDTTNNNTKLSVTTGNGLEKTGTNNDTLSVKAGDGIEVTASGVGVLAGDGLVINSSTKVVDVNPGNGLEISSDAVAIKIDSTSAMADSTHGMLTVSTDGLKLNNAWDCGTY